MIPLPAKNLMLAATVLTGSLVLVILVVEDLGGGLPQLPTLATGRPASLPARVDVAVADWFSRTALLRIKLGTNNSNPFYTTYFQPPPPPPPRTTRKIELTYQGFLETTRGVKRAYVLVGTNLVVGPVGSAVIAGFTVGDITLGGLTLKHSGAPAIALSFGAKKEVEISVE